MTQSNLLTKLFRALVATMLATLSIGMSYTSHAQCPFTPSGLIAAQATTDGLILMRSKRGATSTALTANTGTLRAARDITSEIAANDLKLDVNGSGGFDSADALIIARYLAGFRGDALVEGGAGVGANRTTGAEIEQFINSGCPGAVVPTRSGNLLYYFNTKLKGVNMANAPLTSQERLTIRAVEYVGSSVAADNAMVVAQNDSNAAVNSSSLTFYRANGTVENTYNYEARIIGAPWLSPDGQTVIVNVRVLSGQLGVPATLSLFLLSRTTGNSVSGLVGNYGAGWTSDGRPAFAFTNGIGIASSATNLATGTVIPNTAGALDLDFSRDGTRVAFTAAASAGAPSYIFMANIDGSGLRQVTTSRSGGQSKVVFSPNGQELVFVGPECGIALSSARYVQIISSTATLADVTAADGTTLLRVDGNRACVDGNVSWR
jgi:hypothetical protein